MFVVVLAHIKAILLNPYFYLEPYIHQIITLVLSVILMENNNSVVDLMIQIKDFAIQLLKLIFIKYEIKYPNFINQLLNIFKDNLVPNKNNPKYLSVYGAIKVN